MIATMTYDRDDDDNTGDANEKDDAVMTLAITNTARKSFEKNPT